MSKNNTDSLYLTIKQKILEMLKEMPLNSRIPTRNVLTERFGVARTTIDRAISELTGEGYLSARIGSGTYVVSHGAYSPVKYSKSIWGILLPSVTLHSFPELIRAAEDVCSEVGISLVLCNTDNDVKKQEKYIDQLLASNVSGMIIIPALDNTFVAQNRFKSLIEAGIKIVFCARGVEYLKIPKITVNDFYGAKLATSFILDRGWKKPAFISKRMYEITEQRYCGYLSALYEHNILLDEKLVCLEGCLKSAHPGYDFMQSLLSMPEPPDSVFCFNDEVAIDAYQAILDAGLEVGKDIGIVGYDDTHACEEVHPKLTSVRPLYYEIGKIASQTLLGMIEGNPVSNDQLIVLKPELIVRESC